MRRHAASSVEGIAGRSLAASQRVKAGVNSKGEPYIWRAVIRSPPVSFFSRSGLNFWPALVSDAVTRRAPMRRATSGVGPFPSFLPARNMEKSATHP